MRYPGRRRSLHGHAHRGAPEGRTVNGTPVYNVARPLLMRTWPDRPPFRILELARTADAAATTPAPERQQETVSRV